MQVSASARRVRKPRFRWWAKALVLFGGLIVAFYFLLPRLAKWYLTNRIIPKLERKFDRKIEVGSLRIGWERIELEQVTVRSAHDLENAPFVHVPSIKVEYELITLLRGNIVVPVAEISQAKVVLVRHKDGSTNYEDLFLHKGGAKRVAGKFRVHKVEISEAEFSAHDQLYDGEIFASKMDGYIIPDAESQIMLSDITLRTQKLLYTIHFTNAKIFGQVELFQKITLSRIELEGGRVKVFPKLVLTGISGTLLPKINTNRWIVDLTGSYGGAEAKLWQAAGWLEPTNRRGDIRIKADRFKLDRIRSILSKTPIVWPKKTSIDGLLNLKLEPLELVFSGELILSDLNLFHPALAKTVVQDLDGELQISGKLDFEKQILNLEYLKVKIRGVEAILSGEVVRLPKSPLIVLRFSIPNISCQNVLDAIPSSLVPHLKGFELRGDFSADIRTKVDYQDLEQVELSGDLGIDHCKVVNAPPYVKADRLQKTFEQVVEVAPGQSLSWMVGPENPDFVPYAEISPHVIAAFLTTEDGAFFRHKGFIVSQFRKAIALNLERGSFRLGASTITMQMVKNTLLNSEKTLARKVQELFLTWYLEQELSKERIIEIYLNVIEFGPGIYGIGPAAQHFFGKSAKDISPLEAAFFATVLPNPKKRYMQYCHGQLSPSWDRFVRRVLSKMHQREHISDSDFEADKEKPLIFHRDFKEFPEKDCLLQIKELIDEWIQTRQKDLRDLVMRFAPHQASLYLGSAE